MRTPGPVIDLISETILEISRILTGIGGFWKVIKIDNAIFQDLESFGKGRFLKLAMEKCCIFIRQNSRIS